MTHEYTMYELAEAVDLPVRTIRFYIQKGLVDRPIGARKTARYLAKHLEQCLKVKRWSESGLSLDRIAEALAAPPENVPQSPKKTGELSVSSRIYLSPGVELVIDHELAKLNQSQLRHLAHNVIPIVEAVTKQDSPNGSDNFSGEQE